MNVFSSLTKETIFQLVFEVVLNFSMCKTRPPTQQERITGGGLLYFGHVAANIYLIVGLIVEMFVNISDIGAFVEQILYIVLTLLTYIYILMKSRKSLVDYLIRSRADGNADVYDDEDLKLRYYRPVWLQEREAVQWKCCIMFFLLVSVTLFLAIYPLITFSVYYYYHYRTTTIIIAGQPDYINYRAFAVLPAWNPFEIDTAIVYLSVCLFQLIMFVTNNMIVISVLCLYFYVDGIIAAEVKCLIRIIEQQRQIVKTPSNEEMIVVTSSADLLSLSSCSEHYRLIVRLANDAVICFRWLFFCCGIVVFSSVVSNVYLIIATTTDRKFFKIMSHLSTFLTDGSIYFLACNVGQRYTEINRQFQNAIYATNWYERSIEHQREILSILRLSNREIRMQYAPNWFVSCELFNRTARWIYSFINFLLKVKRGGQ